MTCDACRKRGKTWRGDDPSCSFQDGGAFSREGWNCATANLIRDVSGQDRPHPNADCRYIDDQWYSTIMIPPEIELDSGPAYALWITWYKHRGRTDAMWLLSEDAPRLPNEKDCVEILRALGVSFESLAAKEAEGNREG